MTIRISRFIVCPRRLIFSTTASAPSPVPAPVPDTLSRVPFDPLPKVSAAGGIGFREHFFLPPQNPTQGCSWQCPDSCIPDPEAFSGIPDDHETLEFSQVDLECQAIAGTPSRLLRFRWIP